MDIFSQLISKIQQIGELMNVVWAQISNPSIFQIISNHLKAFQSSLKHLNKLSTRKKKPK